jgi:hypothetical protein
MLRPLALALAFIVAGTAATEDVFNKQNPAFNPGTLAPGTATTWTFRTSTDNAVARVLIDSEGKEIGAVPDGYAELVLRAQDELRDDSNRVQSSSDMTGHLRVMSHSFGYDTDPKRGACRGAQCPDTFEVMSSRNLRMVASGDGGQFDVVVGGRPGGEIARRLIVDKNGVTIPDLAAARRRMHYACIDETGKLVSRRAPCDQPAPSRR